jgi:uncharacterized protein YbjQ (UPF0145 family)
MRKLDVCLAAVLVLAGCSAVQRRAADEPRVEIFTTGRPEKPFVEIAKLDLHVEKWNHDAPSVEEFRPELESEARLRGADAVIDIEWKLKGTTEAGIYHVKAKAIAYVAHPTQAEQVAPGTARPADSGGLAEPGPPAAGTPGDIEIVSGAPSRPFMKVSHLDLYVEKVGAGEPSLEDVLPELKRQARLSGAEAVMDVEWTLRGTKDAGVYHVTATGIAYSHVAPVGR